MRTVRRLPGVIGPVPHPLSIRAPYAVGTLYSMRRPAASRALPGRGWSPAVRTRAPYPADMKEAITCVD